MSGLALLHVVAGAGDAGYDELAEVPMMAAMYSVAFWGVWRRQEAQKALQRSAEREHEFVRNASHLLRTPITVAAGHAALIKASAPNPSVASDAETVLEELDRLSTISDRLLLLQSAEDQDFLWCAPVEMGALVRATVQRWAPTTNRNWSVSIEAEGLILADAGQLSLALDCLVENALHATQEGDLMSIACRTEGSSGVFEVADSGRGIPKQDQKRIFERFTRISAAGDARGTGLGLPIVAAIASAHQGSVEVESEPGAGTTFRIRVGGLLADAGPDISLERSDSSKSGGGAGVTLAPR